MNARKVAIGRILLDPANPRHYLLYLESRALVYIPFVAGAGGVVGAAVLAAYGKEAYERALAKPPNSPASSVRKPSF